MDLFKELKIGDRLEIEIPEVKRIVEEPILSQLVDIKGELFFISNPLRKGIPYHFFDGQQIKIIFYREEKGIFSFLAEIKYKLQGSIVVYAITPKSTAEKIQRRHYYRLNVSLKVKMKSFEEESYTDAITKDISGGGMKLVSRKEYPLKTIVECVVTLREGDSITITGEVVRSIRSMEGERELGIRFKDISESINSKIISFIFEKQRLLRKKGLI